MYFGKLFVVLLIVSCVAVNTQKTVKRKISKKIKKANIPSLTAPTCKCQSPTIDIINCGCRGPIIEPVYGQIEMVIPNFPTAVVDVPNYRYADPLEISPLGCLFPTYEISNYGVIASASPSLEIFAPLDLPCGCSGTCSCSKCSCRTPAVKIPVENCGCKNQLNYGVTSVLELPSFTAPSCGCRGPCTYSGVPVPSCDCIGPCSCSLPVSSCSALTLSGCDCIGPCSCPGLPPAFCGCSGPCNCLGSPFSSCGCTGLCSCVSMPISSCGCSGPCNCLASPVSSCGCSDPCNCLASPVSSCGCSGPCNCLTSPVSSCGCSGPCNCLASPVSCGCPGPCSCLGIQMPFCGYALPAIEVPSCGCGCGIPECGCNPKYLRQVVLPPPFL